MILQDFDRIGASNESTSLLSFAADIGRRKARVVGEWLEAFGFDIYLNERRFGPWTKRGEDEPAVALCGVDNALARAALEKPGFGLIVEAGLGAGPEFFPEPVGPYVSSVAHVGGNLVAANRTSQ